MFCPLSRLRGSEEELRLFCGLELVGLGVLNVVIFVTLTLYFERLPYLAAAQVG